MRRNGAEGARALAVGLAIWAGAAAAQPADGDALRFADDEGCVWLRVEIGDAVAWAAAIGEDGDQICEPELAGAAEDPAADSQDASTPENAGAAIEAAPAASPVVREARRGPKGGAPVFPAPGHYVQVGAFAEPENAARVVVLLHGAGYGVLKQDFHLRAGLLRALFAGPFATRDEAEAARALARENGMGDALIWSQR